MDCHNDGPAKLTKEVLKKADESKWAPPPLTVSSIKNTKPSQNPQVSAPNADKGANTSGGSTLDADKHAEKGWENYNVEVYHGLEHGKSLMKRPNTFTKKLAFVGKPGDPAPSAIIKGAETSEFQKHQENGMHNFLKPGFTTAHREVIYHKLANEVFGMGHYVPKTSVFKHPETGEAWSAQEFRHDVKPSMDADYERKPLDPHLENNGELHKLAIMNTILGNNDRHDQNYMLDQKNRPVLIDNGLAMDYNHNFGDIGGSYPKYARNVLHKPLPEAADKWLWSIDTEKLANTMHKAGVPHDHVMAAVKRLVAARQISNLLKHGHKVYGPQSMKYVDSSLATLLHYMQLHNLKHTPQEIHQATAQFMKDIMNKAKTHAEQNLNLGETAQAK